MNHLASFLCLVGLASSAAGALRLPEKHSPWTASRITGSPHPPAPYRVERVFPKIEFRNPVEVIAEPGRDRFWCVEHLGKIFAFDNRPDAEAELVADLKADVSPFDRVYGFQFHPDFVKNRFVFLAYNTVNKTDGGTRLARFTVRDTNPPTLDYDSERLIITWRSGGHNGCSVHFGPDGYLYFSTGDSEVPSPPDPLNTGQDISDLLGSIIRIDVDQSEGGRNYAIPADNPFVNTPGARAEVWAYGLRNPWRMSFDDLTGDLLVGDVGWELWEMVYRVVKGGNYGWSITEGPQPVKPNQPAGPTPIRKPLVSHSHVEAMSITGGYTWRGKRLPELGGHWLYGDYVTGKIWGLKTKGDEVLAQRELLDSHLRVICFVKEASGEILVVDYAGQIYRFERNHATAATASFPRRLSETGLFSDTARQRPNAGVLPYEIAREPWMDGATARRFVGLPGRGRLDYHRRNDPAYGQLKDLYEFPTNAVLAKTISLKGRNLETQILHFDGTDWHPYNYIWNEGQTDAELADGKGFNRKVGGLDWRFHGDTECMTCHMARQGIVLGFHPQFTDVLAEINGAPQRQQAAWQGLGVIDGPSKLNLAWRAKESALQREARTWLHVNCAHCHRQGGGGTAPFELRADQPFERKPIDGVKPNQGTFGLHDPDILRAGDPWSSLLLYRIAATGGAHMPRLGARTVDPDGIRLVRDWIHELGGSPPKPGDHRAFDYDTDLADTAKSLRLALELDGPQHAKARAELAGHVGRMSPAVYDLFARFLPESARRKTLGDRFEPNLVLDLSGDAAAGEKLFFENPALQCANCHQVRGRGKSVGPELSRIATRYDRARLLESMMDPSKFVDPQFAAYSLDTVSDESFSGFVISRSADEVKFRDLNGVEHVFKKSAVAALRPSQLSLMPAGLLAGLTAAEAADLLAFLAALK
ncbi:MAG: PQQ-dependent sugar dehydrogenase [Verrucomicrobiae bacterium]|nr:PQQ-dependent sugar dehydrogenase [Verrucomicrobiae bacterium]